MASWGGHSSLAHPYNLPIEIAQLDHQKSSRLTDKTANVVRRQSVKTEEAPVE